MDLELRRWTTSDAAALRRAVATSPDLVLQLGDADLRSEAACAAHIDEQWVGSRADRVDRAICVDGVAVGHVGLSQIEHRHDTAWVSYWVAETFRGRRRPPNCVYRGLGSVYTLCIMCYTMAPRVRHGRPFTEIQLHRR